MTAGSRSEARRERYALFAWLQPSNAWGVAEPFPIFTSSTNSRFAPPIRSVVGGDFGWRWSSAQLHPCHTGCILAVGDVFHAAAASLPWRRLLSCCGGCSPVAAASSTRRWLLSRSGGCSPVAATSLPRWRRLLSRGGGGFSPAAEAAPPRRRLLPRGGGYIPIVGFISSPPATSLARVFGSIHHTR